MQLKKFCFSFYCFNLGNYYYLLAAAASCCSSKSKVSTASADATPSIGADIEQRTNAAGEVSYVRKVVNAETGAISYADVEYCTKTNQFVEASTTAVEAKKTGCADGEKADAGCCSKSKTEAAPPVKGKGAKTKV